MENSTEIRSFVFAMYGNTDHLKYLLFTLALLFYISVIFANTLLIVIIYVNRNLHEPMYLFLCNLFVNEIYGSTSLLPCLMVQILSDTHEISVFFCFIQIFNIHTYIAVEFGTLTIMAYDRYACICKPLHYNTIITTRKVQIVIFVIWVVSFVEVGVLLDFLRQQNRYDFCFEQCIGPFLVITLLYLRVFVVAVSQARAMRSHIAVTLHSETVKPKKSEIKAARTLGIVIFVFLLCSCPYYVYTTVAENNSFIMSSLVFPVWLLYCNSCINPVIYALFYPWFRKSALKDICCIFTIIVCTNVQVYHMCILFILLHCLRSFSVIFYC
uniref:G-protein coupled receptors family 1 profile domain-containing protein n=1 Tax=Anabas testudineus TaxID=64144 RepID=A0A3Q1JF76_ANATE